MFVIGLTRAARLLLYRLAGLPDPGRLPPLQKSVPKFYDSTFFPFIDKNPDNLFPYIP